MDIFGISAPQGLVYPSPSQGVPRPAPQPQAAAVPAAPVPATAEQALYEEVQLASQAVKQDYFAVSDVTFTIFKDIAGDYVTRYTSLKDGSVTYFPQKTLFEMVKIRKSQTQGVYNQKA